MPKLKNNNKQMPRHYGNATGYDRRNDFVFSDQLPYLKNSKKEEAKEGK